MPPRRPNSSSPAKSALQRQSQRKLWLGIVAFMAILSAICALVVAVMIFRARVTVDNPRYILQRVNISSTGFFGKSAASRRLLLGRLNLTVGTDNLFALDPRQLRERLLLDSSTIEAVKIIRQLPDTLTVEIFERTPRAFVGRLNSPWVVDANCRVMPASECFGVHSDLPYIIGTREALTPGATLDSARYAMNVIMHINRAFPDFTVSLLGVDNPDRLQMTVKCRGELFNTTMPVGEYRRYLDVLWANIDNALNSGNTQRHVNLTYDGQVVMR